MNLKILTIIGMIFLLGISGFASAEEYAGIINNISGIYISNFFAGDTTTANFSYNYLDYYGDEQYPHILQINITSEDQVNYPVWKNDFELSGFVREYTFFGLFHTDIGLECSELSPLTINHPLGLNVLNVSDGIFYCYNTASEAIDNLDKHDEVYLTIKSHPALWPGQYNLMAKIFYLNDTNPPIVNITNKNYFETTYLRELDYLEITATINENVGGDHYWGTIVTEIQNISVDDKHQTGDIYYLSTILPIDILEGDWKLIVTAQDTSGNIGYDNTTLKIDRTPPEINLIQPNSSIYVDTIPIELEVTDAKAGVNISSVKYRISEIVNSSFCPSTGVIFGNFSCYNSGWISTTYNTSTTHYHDEFNSTLMDSGEYWFEAEAQDLLGNVGVL